jgi:hypothetical protein
MIHFFLLPLITYFLVPLAPFSAMTWFRFVLLHTLWMYKVITEHVGCAPRRREGCRDGMVFESQYQAGLIVSSGVPEGGLYFIKLVPPSLA